MLSDRLFGNLSGFVAKNAALVAFPTVASQEKSGAGISLRLEVFLGGDFI